MKMKYIAMSLEFTFPPNPMVRTMTSGASGWRLEERVSKVKECQKQFPSSQQKEILDNLQISPYMSSHLTLAIKGYSK